MFDKPVTKIQKRAVAFALKLVTKYGFSHNIHIASDKLADLMADNGDPISPHAIHRYWRTLEDMGYLKREMRSRKHGATYHLNRYALKTCQDCV